MTDYGRPVEFGIFPSPDAADLDQILTLAAIADREGLDLIGIQDHPYQRRFLDTWMLVAAVLVRTTRVRVFPDVTNLPLRPPAVLAKSAASLDQMSEVRFGLGLGAGGFWEAITAMGGPNRTKREAVDALVEAIAVIRLMWSDQRSVRYPGTYYQLAGVKPGPQPAHDIGIWLGAVGPRMLALVGRLADGWVPSSGGVPRTCSPRCTPASMTRATSAGRDPRQIRRVYNVWGAIDGDGGFLNGPAEQWIDELTAVAVEHGMDAFVFGPSHDPVHQVQHFAAETAPAVREAVARHRHQQSSRGADTPPPGHRM